MTRLCKSHPMNLQRVGSYVNAVWSYGDAERVRR